MTVSQWAAEKRILSSVSSSEPGKWKNERTPYLVEPMDAMTSTSVQTIVLIFASQTGKSESLFNLIGYHVNMDPCPMMMVQPTVEMAEAVSKDRVQPMFRETTVLAEIIGDPKAKDSGQTIRHMTFPGGQLTFVGANAPAALASRPIRIVMGDEVDRFPISAGDEGDPMGLAIRRTATFPLTKKIVMTSTPTIKGVSRIEKEFEKSDKRFYFLPCPHCDHMQALNFEKHVLAYMQEGEPSSKAAIHCLSCGAAWSESQRRSALSKGKWIATAPGDGKTRGYHLSGLYSPWYTIAGIYQEYLDSEKDSAMKRVFVNTVLAETYRDELDAVEESQLMARREDISLKNIPAEVLLLAGGADVQKDRVELTTLGYSENQVYVLAHEVIFGDPTGEQLWEDLDAALKREFQHPLGGKLKYDTAAIDSGNWTHRVYAFASGKQLRRIYAVKGVPGPRPIWKKSKIKLKIEADLYLVGSDTAKSDFMRRLANEDPSSPGYVHWWTAELEYFEQVLSEYREVEFVKGYPIWRWHRKPGRQAEALDCFIYADAARLSMTPNWEERRKKLTVKRVEQKTKKSFKDVASKFG